MMRKLQAASKQASPLGPPKGRGAVGRVAGRGLQGIREEDGEQQQREKARRKEVDSMKARIVAQMAEPKEDDTEEERENMPPVKNEVRKRKDVDVRADRLQRKFHCPLYVYRELNSCRRRGSKTDWAGAKE